MGTLRTIFALAVAIAHAGGIAGYVPMNGDTAVQAFYVVSGFYMAMVFTEKYAVLARPARTFWLSRYLRLAPAYIVVAAISLWIVNRGLLDGLDVRAWLLIMISQVAMLGQDVFAFLAIDHATGQLFFVKNFHALDRNAATSLLAYLPVPQGWTLGLEAAFYLCVPLLARRRTRTLALLAAAILSLHLAGMYLLGLRGDPWTYRFFPFELAVFLFGMLAYRAMRAGWVSRYPPAIFPTLVVLAVAYHYIPGGGAEKRWVYVVALALSVPTIFQFTKASAVDRWIGDFSYPLYIVHLLAFAVVGKFVSGGWLVPAELAAAVGAALILTLAIEHPMDRLRARLSRSDRVPPAAATAPSSKLALSAADDRR
jgi:peptidoglycan/LPS O-acetylase OafA/YrhL